MGVPLGLDGVLAGHWSDPVGRTGCTVVLCPAGATAAVDVRGGAPGTRETALLRPGNLVQQVHAVLLTGGSAYGLAAADGVMRWLEERGHGFETPVAHVPIVPAAVLFDLAVGSAAARPNADAGYAACQAASAEVAEGQVGAGAGALVGKLLGMGSASPGGLGCARIALDDGTQILAIVAVNAFGHVVDPERGTILAGPRGPDGTFVDTVTAMLGGAQRTGWPGANTTIGVIITNAQLSAAECGRVATQAHNGLARTIRPAHTTYDGDTLFVLSVPGPTAGQSTLIGSAAAEAVASAVIRAVTTTA